MNRIKSPAALAQETMPYDSFAEQMRSVLRWARDDRFDGRLERAPTGAGEIDPTGGGFLVEQDYAAAIIGRAYTTGQILRRVFHLPVGAKANSVKVPIVDETSRATGARFGGISATWLTEGVTIPPSQPKFKQEEMDLHKLIALVYATNELTIDSTSLPVILEDMVSGEIGWVTENAIVNGTGAGMPLGVMNSPAKIVVSKETGQAAATIVSQNVTKMWSRMWGPARSGAVWLVHQDLEPQLYGLSTIAGAPMYVPATASDDEPFNRLLGRPVIPCEYCQAPGTEGDVIFADFGSYAVADKAPDHSLSLDVKFLTDEAAFRFRYRVDGRPLWSTPMVPANGTTSTSPFVTLAAR